MVVEFGRRAHGLTNDIIRNRFSWPEGRLRRSKIREEPAANIRRNRWQTAINPITECAEKPTGRCVSPEAGESISG
jgi:hypothetical protein